MYNLAVWETELADIIREIRTKEYKTKKQYRPFFSLARFSEGINAKAGKMHKHYCVNNCFVKTEALLFDVDDVVGWKEKRKIIFLLEKKLLFAFISPSKKGVKFAIKIKPEITSVYEYKKNYEFYLRQFENMGIKCDNSTTDARRLCFLSSDSSAYYNPECQPAKRKKELINVKEPPRPEPETNVKIKLKGDDLDTLVEYFSKRGHYNDWLAVLCGLAGASNGYEVLEKIRKNINYYDMSRFQDKKLKHISKTMTPNVRNYYNILKKIITKEKK